MNKSKLSSFAIAGAIGLASLSPITTVAAETKKESTRQTEIKTDYKDCKDKKAEFDKKMKAAREKWSSLSQTQKDEVYSLLENKMKENNKVLDKLVELKVLEQSDVGDLKANQATRYQKMKESGEFPLLRGKGMNKNHTR
jgi:catalase